jgi:TRAP-type transport system periplasmic protein
MKKRVNLGLIFILCALLFVIPLSACGQEAEPTTTSTPSPTATSTPTTDTTVYNLRYNCILPAGSWSEDWANKYADDIEQLTDGRVKIEVFMSAALGGPAEAVDLLNTGIADIVYHAPPFTPGVFPLSEVSSLPFICNSADDVLALQRDLIEWDKCTEYDGLKVLTFLPTNPVNFSFTDKKVASAAEMAGTKMRAPGGGPYAEIFTVLGATPASIPTADVYMSLERGIVDGISTNASFLTQIKGWEVLDYGLRDGVNGGLHMMLMSKAAWDKLPADLQGIIDDYNTKYEDEYLAFNLSEDEKAFGELQANGVEIYSLSAAELADWMALAKPIIAAWETAANEKGLPGTEVVAKARQYGGK